MGAIGILGLLAGITVLIVLSYRGVNAFVASLIATAIVIVCNWMPFWGSFTTHYATGMKNFAGSYFLLFGLAAAYGEFMNVSGSAESVANTLFKLFGSKWAPVACILVTLLMAMGGISAFVIVFAVYPVAAPLFRKSNITKEMMPGIFLCASVTLTLCLPGNPTSTNALLTMTKLGTNAYAGPKMGIVAGLVGLLISGLYVTWAARRETVNGNGYVVSGSDSAEAFDEQGKLLPPFWSSILPLLVVIGMMFTLKSYMSAVNCITTSLLIAMALVVVLNYNAMKGKALKTFSDGYWSSIAPLVLTGGVMGFAAVVQNAPGFQYFVNFAMGLSDTFNPYVSAAVAVNVVAGITGTALGGLQIFSNTMLDSYLALNINPEAFHRLMVIACCGLDTLPHCATFITMSAVCGVSVKGSYKHVFPLTVIMPLFLTALCIIMATVGFI
ncbi:H+/gluconate symporter and related permeases [uncultured delta proteobacterium]|uniref:H+/gluconate symporter and related permeases n=1 Tax=uncultured delta proteobacterium TaxID=34034 RepID=A0A212KHA1_9DELT|nr:H+/gluconate symporter and related permeases [uncultured delta proteobacterium]